MEVMFTMKLHWTCFKCCLQMCLSLPPAERYHMAIPPQQMYTEQKMHSLRLRLDRPKYTTIILDSDADSDTIDMEQLSVT